MLAEKTTTVFGSWDELPESAERGAAAHTRR